MKEVKEWNGKTRKMLVWNKEEDVHTAFVVCILSADEMKEGETFFPVRAVFGCYRHCRGI